MLAVEKARQLSAAGFRVLLTCYNAPLGELLIDEFRPRPGVKPTRESTPLGAVLAGSFHYLCRRSAKETGLLPTGDRDRDQDWWDIELPNLAAVTARLDNALAGADRERREPADKRSAVRSAEERIRDLTLTPVQRKELERQHREVQRQLVVDLDARGDAALVADADGAVLARLGPVPVDGTGREIWKATAGRIEQHRAAYDVPANSPFGPKPPNGSVDAFAMSHRGLFEAIARHDRAMSTERGLGRDAPGISL